MGAGKERVPVVLSHSAATVDRMGSAISGSPPTVTAAT